ncbi:MAG: recombinase family protein [Candidatus Paceibacterota bacterium]
MKTDCVIYARVSSREQEETGYSLDAQEKLLKEYAGKRNLTISKVFRISESASGKQIRLVFNEMLEYTVKNDVNIILCEKIDRLTRNLKDASIVNDWIQEDEAREVHFVKENSVVNKNTRAHENLVWDMKIAIARFYTNNLSEEVKKGQKEKIAQGWLPCTPPLGYKTIGDKGHKIHVIDEVRGPFMKKAFEYYATGNYSLMALSDKLYSEGLRARNGCQLGKSCLHEILKDPFFYGDMIWKGVLYRGGKQEPLISKELFDSVQTALVRDGAPHYKRRQHIFSKMIHCGECGSTIYGEVQKGHIYYSCKHYKTCSQRYSTREEEIENSILSVFRIFEAITPVEAEQLYQKIRDDHKGESEYKENMLKALQERYNSLQKRLDILYDDHLDEKITRDRWESKQAEIMSEQEGIQSQIARLKNDEVKYFERYIDIIDIARRSREIYEKRNPMERRMILKKIFSNLVINNEKVSYTLEKSVEMIAKRVQEKIDSEKLFEPQKTLVQKGQKGVITPLHPALLRRQDSNL